MAREVVKNLVAVDIILGRAFRVREIELEGVQLSGVVSDPIREQSPSIVVTFGRTGMKVVVALLDG